MIGSRIEQRRQVGGEEQIGSRPVVRLSSWRTSPAAGITVAVLGVLLTTWLLRVWALWLHVSNVAMAYVVLILAIATTFGRGPAIVAALLALVAFDWTFVEPVGHLAVSDPDEWLMLITFLATGLVTGQLAGALRQRAQESRERAQDTHLLYELTSAMSSQVDLGAILDLTAGRVRELFGAPSCEFLLRDEEGRLPRTAAGLDVGERFPFGALLLPLRAGEYDFGAVYVGPRADGAQPYTEKEWQLLTAFANHAALAIERTRMARELTEAQLVRESDALKSALLSSISHDLRTPLAGIKAFATGLLEAGEAWDPATVRESLTAIDEETDRLNRLVGNLLDISRLQTGGLQMNRDWYSISDAISEAVRRQARTLAHHPTSVDAPPDLPLVWIDYPLIQQVLTNLLENAARHTPPGTRVTLSARREDGAIRVSVADQGPGIVASEREAVFQRFYRLERSEGKRGGTGLGLAICRGFVEAHGGTIWVDETRGPGTTITFSIPLDGPEVLLGQEVDSGGR